MFKVNGVLLNKLAATFMCTLSVDLSGAQLSIQLSDYMGSLNSGTLCYLLTTLVDKDSQINLHSHCAQ